MKELLSGIRVIKYFNWQNFFTDRINEKRREELKHLAGTWGVGRIQTSLFSFYCSSYQ
jgi:hypothetical protein